MKKHIAALFVLTACSTAALAYEQYNPYQTNVNSYQYQTPQQPLRGAVFMVPAGVMIPAVATSEINTQNLMTGQTITLSLGQDYYYNNKLVAPAGSVVNGTVVQLKKGSFAGRNGLLQVRFTSLVTPYGQMLPISGMIKTDDNTGVLKGGTAMDTTKAYAKDIAIGSAVGALGGTIMGPLSGGQVGRGAALGTAVGAGLGLGKSVIDKGGDVVIPANSIINISIDQPITVAPTQNYSY